MRDEKQQEILMTEAVEAAVVEVDEEVVVGRTGHHQRMAARHVAALRPLERCTLAEESIVAVFVLELHQFAVGKRQAVAVAGTGRKGKPNVIRTAERVALVDRDESHLWHAI